VKIREFFSKFRLISLFSLFSFGSLLVIFIALVLEILGMIGIIDKRGTLMHMANEVMSKQSGIDIEEIEKLEGLK